MRPLRRALNLPIIEVMAAVLLAGAVAVGCSVAAPAPSPAAPPAAQPAAPQPGQPAAATAQPSPAPQARALKKIDLAFCSQVLCVLPYEIAKQKGFFAEEGYDVNLIYMRGGPPAVTALLSNSLDYIGTTMDLVVQSRNQGKEMTMVTSTGNLPFFAMVTSPKAAGSVQSVKDLAGKKIGVGNLGATDHLLAQYLLTQNGLSPDSVEFVALGPNLLKTLTDNQVEIGMVQEPALTRTVEAGGKLLVNFMEQKDAKEKLGGSYQFMGLIVRPDTQQKDPESIERLSRALVKANRFIQENPGAEIVKAAPADLVSGDNVGVFTNAIDKYKKDLYPTDGMLSEDAVQRVVDVQKASKLVPADKQFAMKDLFTNQYIKK